MLSKLLVGFAASTLFIGLSVGTASAQRAQTYVASTGSDNNTCTQTAPCRTLGGAIAKTPTSGQINILDSSEYGPSFEITKSVYIEANGLTATITPTQNQTSMLINAPNSNVSIRGLTFAGDGFSTVGVAIINAADVEIENCIFDGQSNAIAIYSKAATRAHVYKSIFHQNVYGIVAIPGAYVNGIIIDESTFDENTMASIYMDGSNGALLVGNSSIQGGPALVIRSGQPTIQSYGDNRISSAFPASIIQRQ